MNQPAADLTSPLTAADSITSDLAADAVHGLTDDDRDEMARMVLALNACGYALDRGWAAADRVGAWTWDEFAELVQTFLEIDLPESPVEAITAMGEPAVAWLNDNGHCAPGHHIVLSADGLMIEPDGRPVA